jgi:hypothetical protein
VEYLVRYVPVILTLPDEYDEETAVWFYSASVEPIRISYLFKKLLFIFLFEFDSRVL